MKTPKTITLTPLEFIEKTLEEMSACDANLKSINSSMDQEIFEIRKKNSNSITTLQQQKDEAFNKLEAFALENQTVLFSIKKSLDTKFGKFGFRTCKAKFQLLEGFNWLSVTKMMAKILPNYVRTVIEPAKDKLMADRHLPQVYEYLPDLGLTIVQDEVFFVDLKKE